MKKAFVKGIVAVVFVFGSMGLTGCGLLNSVYENSTPSEEPDIEDEYVTGAWNDGMFWCGDYRVDLECPQAGHPSGSADSEWSTGYELDDGTDVNVDFFSREGAMEDRISELENQGFAVEEGMLWENPCYFYVDEVEFVTIAFIQADERNYIEVAFQSWEEEIVPFDEITDEFTLTIQSKF